MLVSRRELGRWPLKHKISLVHCKNFFVKHTKALNPYILNSNL